MTSLIFHVYLKTILAFEHLNPFEESPGSNSQCVSCSLGVTSSCLLLMFLLAVSLALLHLHYLYSSVSQNSLLC